MPIYGNLLAIRRENKLLLQFDDDLDFGYDLSDLKRILETDWGKFGLEAIHEKRNGCYSNRIYVCYDD